MHTCVAIGRSSLILRGVFTCNGRIKLWLSFYFIQALLDFQVLLACVSKLA